MLLGGANALPTAKILYQLTLLTHNYFCAKVVFVSSHFMVLHSIAQCMYDWRYALATRSRPPGIAGILPSSRHSILYQSCLDYPLAKSVKFYCHLLWLTYGRLVVMATSAIRY